MAGGTPEHGAMAVRVAASLVAQLRGKRCNVYSSDVRVQVAATGLSTYPDLSVVCGQDERDVEDRNALTNPIVLIEVLSPSTEDQQRVGSHETAQLESIDCQLEVDELYRDPLAP